jgi:hypothetical protein
MPFGMRGQDHFPLPYESSKSPLIQRFLISGMADKNASVKSSWSDLGVSKAMGD